MTPKKLTKKVALAGAVTVGPKGQVVIPYEVRDDMGIAPGDKLVVFYVPEKKSVGFASEKCVHHVIEKMGSELASFSPSDKKPLNK